MSSRFVLRAVALAALLLLALASSRGAAQDAVPVDVGAGWTEAAGSIPALPTPPEGYVSEQRGAVTWVYPEQARSEVRDLQRAFPERWDEVTEQLGVDVAQELVIRVGRNPEEMRALAPVGHPPPGYASGVAYPRFGVILLTFANPGVGTRPDMEAVLAHELSHVALHRAVGGRPLPRWFVEGVAIHQAEEHTLDRMRTLWEAAASERVVPLAELSARFPSRPHEVNLAYAQSADIIAFLLRRDDGPARFQRLVRAVKDGDAFEVAVEQSFGRSLGLLEADWREEMAERHGTWPLLLGGGTLWVIASLLVMVAWRRRKRRAAAKLARWEEEEAAVDRLEAAVDRALVEAEEQERTVHYVSGDPPQGRDAEVPTVQYEGRNHTLH